MIPHYREVILSSFDCEHCGLKNNEVQSGGRIQVQICFNPQIPLNRPEGCEVIYFTLVPIHDFIQERGVRFRCRIASVSDLARQVVKSDTAMVSVPDIELEIPANSQKGCEC